MRLSVGGNANLQNWIAENVQICITDMRPKRPFSTPQDLTVYAMTAPYSVTFVRTARQLIPALR